MSVIAGKMVSQCIGVVAATAIVGGALFLMSIPATATPKFAAATGQACAACHVKPEGGAELTPFGKAFQANGNKLPKT
jgi:hypothetical protein